MRLVLNADDFGRSSEINRAVERAHLQGVLNSASLMVAGDAAEEAIQIARRNPALAVGIHLVVIDGPTITGGNLPNRPLGQGLRYAFSSQARRWLAAEIAAQFQRFAATGLPLVHVDGHQHMHMHPAVFDLLLPLAEKFGARRIRIVHDDLWLALRCDHTHALGKTVLSLIFRALSRHCRRRCRGKGIEILDRTYGFFQSGKMEEAYVLRVLQQIRTSAEIYFHPCDGARLDELGTNSTDLQTLLSPQIAEAIAGIKQGNPAPEISTFLKDCDRHGGPGTAA